MALTSYMLRGNAQPPQDQSRVEFVWQQGTSTTMVIGVLRDPDGREARWEPAAFDDWTQAFEAAEDWAEANGVTTIFLMRGPSNA